MVPVKKGRYEIKGKLDEGGMGVVFRAYDPPPVDRDVALKTLPAFPDPLALELFYKECRVLKSISHPNVVEIFDMGECEEDGEKKPFFVMPLLPGQTLHEIIRTASHRLTVARVVEIMSQTCRGLQAAHDRGLIHRDLKPSNIFVMADDSVKIIDFGVAHAVDLKSRSGGYAKGTLLYMAPEQLQHKPVSPQSDIFSLGVVCYEALTRRQPFRRTSEEEVVDAICGSIPPPAFDVNPGVGQTISRAVHKAMAKHPWNRYGSVREFGDTLQKALRNEPIELFDPARIQPRLQRASKALESGDHHFADEIVAELEAEGNVDPQLTLLRAQVDQVARQRTIAQLLESARARYEEEEDPLALQKIQEVLQLDPSHAAALGLKAKIEERRSGRQIEQWLRLARQHVDNHSYGPARDALENVLALRRADTRASRLLNEIEAAEQEYLRLRREKAEMYQAALNAWKNGEVSRALSQMKAVLELDRHAPDTTSPETGATYQAFYNKIRSEHDSINGAYAEARRQLVAGEFAKALKICEDNLATYPGHALFQAVKFDVHEQQRQQLSAYIADVDRRLDAEPDLDAKASLLREAIARYPDEAHFRQPLQLIEDKRDLVNSIVTCVRVHEERGELSEALSDLEILETIYSPYPGLKFERERLQKRAAQQATHAAKAKWVGQINRQLDAGDQVRALELLDGAEGEFPGDPEFIDLRTKAGQARVRAERADHLCAEARDLCARGELDRAIETYSTALQLDNRPDIRVTLRDLLVQQAQTALEHDWRDAERLVARALDLDPGHALARSVRAQALDRKNQALVGECADQLRGSRAAGDSTGTVADVAGRPQPVRVDRCVTMMRTCRATARCKSVLALSWVRSVRLSRKLSYLRESARRRLTRRMLAWCTALVVLVPMGLATYIGVQRQPLPDPVPAHSLRPTVRADIELAPEPLPGSLRLVAPGGNGSTVWIDDNAAGTIENASFAFEPIPAGEHTLRISAVRRGSRDASITFASEPGKPHIITAMDVPNFQGVVVTAMRGIVRIRSSVEGAAVAINGHPRGSIVSGGLEITDLEQGVHELVLGDPPATRKMSFALGHNPTIELALFPNPDVGSILLLVDQDDVTVFLDGRIHSARARNGQLRIPNITPGRHTVGVAKDGFKPSEMRVITIAKAQEGSVRFMLAPVERPAPVESLAALVLEQATPGATVSLDGAVIGTVDAEGRFAHQRIVSGPHTVLLTLRGHEPRRVLRDFGAGLTVVVSGADGALQPLLATLEILAKSTTGIVISQSGQVLRSMAGPSKVLVPAGSYTVVARGPTGVATSTTVTVTAGEVRTVDLTSVASGMERFDSPELWTRSEAWFVRKGGGFVLYNEAEPTGRLSFTIRRSRSRIPFVGRWRARWVVGFVDARNYVLMQIDDKYYSRNEVIDGKSHPVHRVPHNVPENSDAINVSLDLTADRVVHQVSQEGKDWQVVDSWTSTTGRVSAEGKFGFYLPGDDEIRISNFLFLPADAR